MKLLKLSILLLLNTLVACAHLGTSLEVPREIAANDHQALVVHYESLAKHAKVRLKENKKILADYEDRSYYYGRKGLDLQSHTSANIRYYEKTLTNSLSQVAFHKKKALAQQKDNAMNKVEAPIDQDLTKEKKGYSSNTGL
jgi:hypothetical protein